MTLPLFLAGGVGVLGGGLAAYSGLTARRVEAAVPQDGETVEIGRDTIHFVDKGKGPAVLMIHGLAGQMRNFHRSLVDDIARDHRVLLVDRPGSGYSVRGAGCARLAVQAETIAEFIRRKQLDRPLLVGHSLGGALSLAVALHYPDLVGGLALVAPLTQPQQIEDVPPVFKGLVIRSPAVRRLVSWTVATPMGVMKAEEGLREVFAPEPVPPEFGVEGGGLLALRPNNFYHASSDLVDLEGELEPMAERYGSISVPVGILYAREDNLLDYRVHGEKTASMIPGAELDLMDGGHMLPFTQPEATIRFIRKVDGRIGRA